MRKIKKITSIVLAALMIVSLFAAVPMTVNAGSPGDSGHGEIGTGVEIGGSADGYVAEKDYLTFTALEDDSSVKVSFQSGSDFKYNKNGTGWQDYEEYYRIWLNKGEYVRLRGSDFVSYYNGGSFSIGGKVAASGNIMSLRLDSESRSQGLTTNCFHMMFAEECDGLITAPELPETTLAEYCYESMFENCRNLTTAPELPATTLANACYSSMFSGCTSLTELPALPATTLVYACYHAMFRNCSSIRISDVPGTYNGIKYSEAYRIPTAGDATNAYEAVDGMFGNTGGKFKGTPNINTTYYIGKPVYTVTWNDWDDTELEVDTGVESGTAPSYDGETPEKAEDETNTYTFSGWSDGTNTYGLTDTLPVVTGNVTYTAQFTATPAVAKIGDAKYYSLADAINAAQNGDTITVIADIDLGTSKINVKKSVNFDLGGKTITGSGAAIFVVYPNKTVSIENGTIENTATTNNHYTIVGNASTVNLGDGAKLAGGYQTYSGAAGAVLNVNEGSTIENTTSFGAAIYNDAVLNVNGGTIKAAVPVTTLGTSGNGGYEINITAGTVESTDEIAIYHVNAGELNITGGTIKGGSEAAVYIKSGTTEISGGTFTSDGEAVKYDSTGSGYAPLDKIEISGGTFSSDVDVYAAPGYVGKQLSATTFGVEVDTNPLGTAPIIGFQQKAVGADVENGVRIITKIKDCDLTQFEEYGYVVAKVTGKQQATANFNNLKAYGGNGEKTIKCNGTVNTIDGYGTPYVTLAVNGMTDGQQVAARFYAIKDGVTYYSNYVSTARYNGIIAAYKA